MYGCFVCKYVCAPHAYLVLGDIRRGPQILWDCSHKGWLWSVLWVLGVQAQSFWRADIFLPAELSLHSPECSLSSVGPAREGLVSLLSLSTTMMSQLYPPQWCHSWTFAWYFFLIVTSHLTFLKCILIRLGIFLITLVFWFLTCLAPLRVKDRYWYTLQKTNVYAVWICGFVVEPNKSFL